MKYKYTAYNNKSKTVKGIVEEPNRQEALLNLKASGLRVIDIKEVKESPLSKLASSTDFLKEKIEQKVRGQRYIKLRIESFKEELEFMGYDELDIAAILKGINKENFDARKVAKKYNLTSIQVEKINSGKKQKTDTNSKEKVSKFSFGMFRSKQKELIMFTEQLSIMLSTDIEMLDALETIRDNIANPEFRKAIDLIIYDSNKGVGFSEALAEHPKFFDNFYISMVQIGENTGNELHNALDDIVKFLKMKLTVKQKMINALIYPSIVLLLLVALIVFVNFFVMPRFITLFESNNFTMPAFTQFVFLLAENMIFIFLALLLIGILCIVAYAKLPFFKDKVNHAFDYICIKFPVVKQTLSTIYMYIISLTLSITLRNGISITNALSLVSNVIANRYYKEDISGVYYSIEKGSQLPEAFEDKKTMDSLFKMSISSGNKSGKLDTTLEKVSNYYEQEMIAKIANLIQFLVPVTLIIVGAVVAPFIIGIYMPLMSLTEQLGTMR